MLSPPGPHPGRRVVLTLGGNALIRPGEKGSVGQQTRRAQVLAENLALLAPDIELVVTHGNGPQVGRTLLRSDLCSGQVPPLPIDLAVASTQGEMGILLQRAIELVTHRPTMALLTQVVVNPQDPGFQNPRKFIGRFYTEEEARQRAQDLDWSIRQDGERGWRRVVASPEPVEIVELDAINAVLNAGITVIACGGGGVPVIRTEKGLKGVEAVVDKDRSSALLAHALDAEAMICLTAVEAVMLDFDTPRERPIATATVGEMRQWLAEGQFPEGSMGPKVRSAIQFLEDGGKEVLITSPEELPRAIRGETGTRILAV